MGGENSENTENTRAVVFESANFNGNQYKKTALALGMRTDASSRFEKGLDPRDPARRPARLRAVECSRGRGVDGVIDA
jgi:phenylalanyl-tRNA synthetase beta chain